MLLAGFALSPYAPHRPDDSYSEQNTNHKTTADDRIADYTLVLAIFSGLLFIVSVTQIGFLIRGEKLTRRSADAAKKSADAALLSMRPWVSCTVGITGTLSYRENGDVNLSLRFTLTNEGKSPAMGVRLQQWFTLERSDAHEHPAIQQQRAAEKALPVIPAERGVLLFPGGIHKEDIQAVIPRDDIDKAIAGLALSAFYPVLVVLVSYSHPLSDERAMTGGLYSLSRLHINNGIWTERPIVLGDDVPVGHLTLAAHELGGAYAK